MNKETSSHVSSIASTILSLDAIPDDFVPNNAGTVLRSYNDLLEQAKTLAASCLSQDETPGQEKQAEGDFLSRLKDEREDLSARLIKLKDYLSHNPGKPNLRHRLMLDKQARLMFELLNVLDQRIYDIERPTDEGNDQ